MNQSEFADERGALHLRTKAFWHVDERPQHVARRVLVIPGVAYSCDRPLLNWASVIAHQRGWWVQQAQWELTSSSNQDDVIARTLEMLDHDAPEADQTLILAKSMGSRAAAAASANGWSGIWLTPLLDVAEVNAALIEYHAPCLVAGGSADPHWVPDENLDIKGITREGVIHGSFDPQGTTWVSVAEANHSLEITDDWRASQAVQRGLFELVDRFFTFLSQ